MRQSEMPLLAGSTCWKRRPRGGRGSSDSRARFSGDPGGRVCAGCCPPFDARLCEPDHMTDMHLSEPHIHK
jgi:hypothetical protein